VSCRGDVTGLSRTCRGRHGEVGNGILALDRSEGTQDRRLHDDGNSHDCGRWALPRQPKCLTRGRGGRLGGNLPSQKAAHNLSHCCGRLRSHHSSPAGSRGRREKDEKLKACFHYGCAALRCTLRAIVSGIASAALCSAIVIYRYISLTIARNAQRSHSGNRPFLFT